MPRHVMNRAGILALLLPFSMLAAGEPTGSFVLSPSQVARAIREAGRQVNDDRVGFLSQVRTRQANPTLKVMSIHEWHDGVQKVEIRCVDRSVCLPFLVLVRDGAFVPDPANSSQAKLQKAFSTLPKRHDVRIGDPAILVFEGNDSRITMRVICAQDGDRGQKIRVASSDRKHFYEAEVIEPGFLKGNL